MIRSKSRRRPLSPRPIKNSPALLRLIASVATAGVLVSAAVSAESSRAGADGAAAVTFTGFDEAPDGTSRLYVKLSRPVTVETVVSGTHLEYFLPGTTIPIRNNKNPLITRHFGVQVVSAQLVPEGGPKEKRKTKKRAKAKEPPQALGVRLVVETREPVKPRYRIVKNQDGSAVLVVDFPKPSKPPPPEPDVVGGPREQPKASQTAP
jgi:hypothetical protein